MPRSMPTIFLFHSVHSRTNCLLLWVNVTLRDIHVAVTCKVCQRPRVHVRCPTGKASMPESVQLESPELDVIPFSLLLKDGRRLLDCLSVLLLNGGRLHVPAPSGSRKDPVGCF